MLFFFFFFFFFLCFPLFRALVTISSVAALDLHSFFYLSLLFPHSRSPSHWRCDWEARVGCVLGVCGHWYCKQQFVDAVGQWLCRILAHSRARVELRGDSQRGTRDSRRRCRHMVLPRRGARRHQAGAEARMHNFVRLDLLRQLARRRARGGAHPRAPGFASQRGATFFFLLSFFLSRGSVVCVSFSFLNSEFPNSPIQSTSSRASPTAFSAISSR